MADDTTSNCETVEESPDQKGEVPECNICEKFEPQAWRKSLCRNCFHALDEHGSELFEASDDSKDSDFSSLRRKKKPLSKHAGMLPSSKSSSDLKEGPKTAPKPEMKGKTKDSTKNVSKDPKAASKTITSSEPKSAREKILEKIGKASEKEAGKSLKDDNSLKSTKSSKESTESSTSSSLKQSTFTKSSNKTGTPASSSSLTNQKSSKLKESASLMESKLSSSKPGNKTSKSHEVRIPGSVSGSSSLASKLSAFSGGENNKKQLDTKSSTSKPGTDEHKSSLSTVSNQKSSTSPTGKDSKESTSSTKLNRNVSKASTDVETKDDSSTRSKLGKLSAKKNNDQSSTTENKLLGPDKLNKPSSNDSKSLLTSSKDKAINKFAQYEKDNDKSKTESSHSKTSAGGSAEKKQTGSKFSSADKSPVSSVSTSKSNGILSSLPGATLASGSDSTRDTNGSARSDKNNTPCTKTKVVPGRGAVGDSNDKGRQVNDSTDDVTGKYQSNVSLEGEKSQGKASGTKHVSSPPSSSSSSSSSLAPCPSTARVSTKEQGKEIGEKNSRSSAQSTGKHATDDGLETKTNDVSGGRGSNSSSSGGSKEALNENSRNSSSSIGHGNSPIPTSSIAKRGSDSSPTDDSRSLSDKTTGKKPDNLSLDLSSSGWIRSQGSTGSGKSTPSPLGSPSKSFLDVKNKFTDKELISLKSPSVEISKNKESLTVQNGLDAASTTRSEGGSEVENRESEKKHKEDLKKRDDQIASLQQKLVKMEEEMKRLEREKLEMEKTAQEKSSSSAGEKSGSETGKEDIRQKGESQKKDIDSMRAKLSALQLKLEEKEGQCKQLTSDNQGLKDHLQSHSNQENENKKIIAKDNRSNEKDKELALLEQDLEAAEKELEDTREDNRELRRQVMEMRNEMDEMTDSFRESEHEEFREMQRELEMVSKNCRILQFKLRKSERRNIQIEEDRAHYEDRLRQLEAHFDSQDARNHIQIIEEELRVAKEVSVRLHDELDIVEDKRLKAMEESRHLTELLEHTDKRQFRMEMEIDKLRDMVCDLKQQLKEANSGEKTTSSKDRSPDRKIMSTIYTRSVD